jgi:hypothetical protein
METHKMAYQVSLPPGLLSFAYNAVYNQQVIHDLRNSDLNEVIKKFELKPNEAEAVTNALSGGQPDEKDLQTVVNLLIPYLTRAYGDVW